MVPLVQVTKQSSDQWTATKEQLDAALAPLDISAATRLRTTLAASVLPALAAAMLVQGNRAVGQRACGAQPYQLFQKLLTQRRLFARPAVSALLGAELKTLGDLVHTYLEFLQNEAQRQADFNGDSAGAAVAALTWVKQSFHKVDVAIQVLAAFVPSGGPHPEAAARVIAVGKALSQRLAALDKVCYTSQGLDYCEVDGLFWLTDFHAAVPTAVIAHRFISLILPVHGRCLP